jgi:hypothetical protein
MVKPEFWSSQSLHRVSLEARLLFIGIWNFSDDFGVCLNTNRKILGEIFPHDEQITERKIEKWKQELIRENLVLPVSYNGTNYLIVRSWKEHQKVDHPSERRWLEDEIIEKLANEYLNTREPLANNSRSKEKGKEKGKEKDDLCVESIISLPFPSERFSTIWKEFQSHRIEIKKKMTPRSEKMLLKSLVNDSNNNEETAIKIIEQSIANGWQGLFTLKNGNGSTKLQKIETKSALALSREQRVGQ